MITRDLHRVVRKLEDITDDMRLEGKPEEERRRLWEIAQELYRIAQRLAS